MMHANQIILLYTLNFYCAVCQLYLKKQKTKKKKGRKKEQKKREERKEEERKEKICEFL